MANSVFVNSMEEDIYSGLLFVSGDNAAEPSDLNNPCVVCGPIH